jgi:uncharacterized protein (DUF924 family)
MTTAAEVLKFWFEECEPKHWFKKDDEFDQMVRNRFGATLAAARNGELWLWRQRPEGRLAEIIVFDQFSRNIYRDRAEAFAGDGVALVLAQEAIASGDHLRIDKDRRSFLYMPYMHSESKAVHEEAIKVFADPDMSDKLRDYEDRHKRIIDRFGRYPHRNQVLGRESTAEEVEFLKEKGSSF